jgi:hypothetical protein
MNVFNAVFIIDLEYYNPEYLTIYTVRPNRQYRGKYNKQKKLQEEYFQRTRDTLNIQDEIYKYDPVTLVSDLIFSFINQLAHPTPTGICAKWADTNIKQTCIKDRQLPAIIITIYSENKIDPTEFTNYISCNDYMQQHMYHEGYNNGWIWYCVDNKKRTTKCEYAITRIIDVKL